MDKLLYINRLWQTKKVTSNKQVTKSAKIIVFFLCFSEANIIIIFDYAVIAV